MLEESRLNPHARTAIRSSLVASGSILSCALTLEHAVPRHRRPLYLYHTQTLNALLYISIAHLSAVAIYLSLTNYTSDEASYLDKLPRLVTLIPWGTGLIILIDYPFFTRLPPHLTSPSTPLWPLLSTTHTKPSRTHPSLPIHDPKRCLQENRPLQYTVKRDERKSQISPPPNLHLSTHNGPVRYITKRYKRSQISRTVSTHNGPTIPRLPVLLQFHAPLFILQQTPSPRSSAIQPAVGRQPRSRKKKRGVRHKYPP